MKNEDRLIEVMAELLAEVHEMRTDMGAQMRSVNEKLSQLNDKTDGLDKRMSSIEKQQAQTNIELRDLRLDVMKLADMSERVIRLENVVFKKTG